MQSERLMRIPVNPFILFQTAPGSVFAVPKEITMDVGHLARDADLVAVEVVDLLAAFAVFGCPIADRYEGFVAVGIDVDIGMFVVRVDFLQQMAVVPNETGLVFEVVPA